MMRLGQHPDRGPNPLPLRQLGAHLDPAIGPRRLAARHEPRRRKRLRRLRLRLCGIAALRQREGGPGHRLLARGDDQLAVPDGRIGGPVGIALALAVAAAPAIDVAIPFAAIDRALVRASWWEKEWQER